MNPQSENFTDFVIRPPQLDDVPAIVALLNVNSLEILGTKEDTVDDYNRMWTSPGYDPALDSRIATTADGTIAAVGHSFSQAPYVRNFLWVAVHPSYRGRGLGTYLTGWGEEKGAQTYHRCTQRCPHHGQQRHAQHLPARRRSFVQAWLST